MADVAACSKKEKGQEEEGKSFNKKLKEAGGQLPGTVSTKNKVEQEDVNASESAETDLLAALSKAKILALARISPKKWSPTKRSWKK